MATQNKKYLETPLISEELLKLFSPISANVDIDKIVGFVPLAQNFYIEPILGRPLVEQLQQEIEENTLTDSDKALLLKIAPSLALWTTYISFRSLAYTITAKGITAENSENSRSLERKELADWLYDIKDKAELATDMLIKYLCNCRELYPSWFPENDCLCDKYNITNGSASATYQETIYFPNKTGKKCNCGK